jgi:hypothetical protein
MEECQEWNGQCLCSFLKYSQVQYSKKEIAGFNVLLSSADDKNDAAASCYGRACRTENHPHYKAVFYLRS